ncbi:MAG: hypothetical protein E6Q42_14405 [Dechloromonas sp.]|nr:MAG: hypothetical protein E6Q42_14405 [Dechloromonas sp.]
MLICINSPIDTVTMEMLAQAIKDANASMARDQGSDQGSDQGEDVFGAPVIAGCRMEHPCRRRFLQAAVNLKYLPKSKIA